VVPHPANIILDPVILTGGKKSRRAKSPYPGPAELAIVLFGFARFTMGGIRGPRLQSMTWGFPLRLKGMSPTARPRPVNNIAALNKPMWKGLAAKPIGDA